MAQAVVSSKRKGKPRWKRRKDARPGEIVAAALEVFVERGFAAAGIPKLMMAEAATFPELTRFYYDEVVARGHRLVAGVIERGIKSGEFHPVDVMVAAKLAMAPVIHAVAMRRAF